MLSNFQDLFKQKSPLLASPAVAEQRQKFTQPPKPITLSSMFRKLTQKSQTVKALS